MKLVRCIMAVGILFSLTIACAGVKQNPTIEPSPQSKEQSNPRIAYAAARGGRSDVYVLDLKTRQEVNLTTSLDRVQDEFDWSPDGTRIVVTNGLEYEESELFLIEVDNGQITRLTDNQTMDKSPAWSPDGRWIAFQSGLNTQYGSKIWIIELETLKRQPLSDDYNDRRGYHFASPVWSPDSKMIAARIRYEQNTIKVFAFDFSSGQVVRIIGSENTRIEFPNWSPDGQMMVHTRTDIGSSSIYLQPWRDESGNELIQLTDLPGSEGWPKWSPDGKAVLFMNAQQDEITYEFGPAHLYTVDIDSLKTRQLTKKGSNFTPSWSPDGEKIAFGTARDGFEFIGIMNRDGSDLMILEETKSDAIWAPKWAPVSQP